MSYGRYVDDSRSTARWKQQAENLVQSIASQDPNNLIKWELDYPEDPDQYTPFLETEIRINDDETLESRKSLVTLDKGIVYYPSDTKNIIVQ